MVKNHSVPESMKKKPGSQTLRGTWTPDEDILLVNLVAKHGSVCWKNIAKSIAGRDGKQCRERWTNHLKPDIKKYDWTEKEEKQLIKAHAVIGNKWAQIAEMIPGKSENAVKNHWYAAIRKQRTKQKKQKTNMFRNNWDSSSIMEDYIRSRGFTMENGKEKQNKEVQEIKQIYDPFFPFAPLIKQDFLAMGSNNICEQNHATSNNWADIAFVSSLLNPSPYSSSALGSGLENQNPNLEMQDFPTEFNNNVNKEMDLVEMILSSVNVAK